MRAAWRVAGTSVVGHRHAASGESCQDRHRVHVTPAGALIAVVSDGAGSAAHGGEGAALLCEAMVDRLDWFLLLNGRGEVTRALLAGACRTVRDAVAQARRRAEARAREVGTSIAAFHATLVGAVMLPGKGGLFFHIGDGAAVALADDGGRWLLSAPRNGEYADTTYFFTQSDWRQQLRFALIGPDYDTIFVMSDGVTDLALQRGAEPKPFLPFFEPIARFLAGASREEGELALSATLDSQAVRARTDDDKTLVWAKAAAR